MDVKSAHKRILINPSEAGLHHVSFQGKLYRYLTCHFGGAWSAWWWSRLSAAIMRLVHAVLGPGHAGVVYVDDFLLLAPASKIAEVNAITQCVLAAIGCPMSEHKLYIGPSVKFIGFKIHAHRALIGIPEDKKELALGFLNKLRKGDRVCAKEIERGRSRLMWVSWIAKPLRPWLAPFFSCIQHISSEKLANSRVRIGGTLHSAALLWKNSLVHCDELHRCTRCQWAPGMAAADAMASGSKVGLGGWWCPHPTFDLEKVKWFRLEVKQGALPAWIQAQVPENLRINFWELVAQCVLVFLRLREQTNSHFDIAIHQACDNAATVGAVRKFFTTKAPMCFALQALAFHCNKAGATVTVSHVPGKKNTLADGLSRGLAPVLNTLPCKGEVKGFTLEEILAPVWHEDHVG
jgi:hypothetical protein